MKNHNRLIKELSEKYRHKIRFDIIKNDDGTILLHDNEDLRLNKDFIEEICNIAFKYLDESEKYEFAVVHDYDNEIRATIQTKYTIDNYYCKDGFDTCNYPFTLDFLEVTV